MYGDLLYHLKFNVFIVISFLGSSLLAVLMIDTPRVAWLPMQASS
jgi:hypothetical protein